jgi:hypothetical protein
MPSLRQSLAVLISILLITAAAPAQEPAGEDAAPAPAAASAPLDLSGCWSGTWLSHRDGHDGPITAHFTKRDDEHYCVHFRGKFWKCFPFKYTVVLTVTERTEDAVKLAGSSNLGLLFGTFWYEATATDTEFVAHYCSKHDRGVFTMCRCCRAGD